MEYENTRGYRILVKMTNIRATEFYDALMQYIMQRPLCLGPENPDYSELTDKWDALQDMMEIVLGNRKSAGKEK